MFPSGCWGDRLLNASLNVLYVSRQVLCSWLSNNPNYEEITKWYLGWKSMLSDAVLAHPSIKEKFNEALDIMNRSVSSGIGQSRSGEGSAVLSRDREWSGREGRIAL